MNPKATLRTYASERRYHLAKQRGESRPLESEPSVWEGMFWRVIMNRYPGDLCFKKDRARMLLTKRKVSDWWKLYPWEAIELLVILYRLREGADVLSLNLGKTRSKPEHFHLHLNDFYDNRLEMKL